jgi:GNAT superfamily N-acetyltransferase
MSRIDRTTITIAKIAWTTIEFEPDWPPYFSNMFVDRKHRANGIGTELIRFVVRYLRVAPEADILRTSISAQTCLSGLGYKKIGSSERYQLCDLWKSSRSWNQFSASRLKFQSKVRYDRADGTTRVIYARQ